MKAMSNKLDVINKYSLILRDHWKGIVLGLIKCFVPLLNFAEYFPIVIHNILNTPYQEA